MFRKSQFPSWSWRGGRVLAAGVVPRNRAAGASLLRIVVVSEIVNNERARGAVPWYHPTSLRAARPPADRRAIVLPLLFVCFVES